MTQGVHNLQWKGEHEGSHIFDQEESDQRVLRCLLFVLGVFFFVGIA